MLRTLSHTAENADSIARQVAAGSRRARLRTAGSGSRQQRVQLAVGGVEQGEGIAPGLRVAARAALLQLVR